MLKQVCLAHFEPVVTRFGQWKIPKCLENGPFWAQKWVKNGSKKHFSKGDTGPFGMLKQVFLARFEPIGTGFGPWKLPIYLEKGPFWEKNGWKMGQKCVYPKVTLDHWGCTNKCFEPIWSAFSPSLARSATRMHQVVPFARTLEPYG